MHSIHQCVCVCIECVFRPAMSVNYSLLVYLFYFIFILKASSWCFCIFCTKSYICIYYTNKKFSISRSNSHRGVRIFLLHHMHFAFKDILLRLRKTPIRFTILIKVLHTLFVLLLLFMEQNSPYKKTVGKLQSLAAVKYGGLLDNEFACLALTPSGTTL